MTNLPDDQKKAALKELEFETKELLGSDNAILVREMPFFGHIIAKSRRIIDRNIPILAVSLHHGTMVLHVNPDTYPMYPRSNRIFGLIHEILHFIRRHHSRGVGKIQKLHNIATDIDINQCIERGIAKIHPSWLVPSMFNLPLELGSEEYYALLLQRKDEIKVPESLRNSLLGEFLKEDNCQSCGGTGENQENGDGGKEEGQDGEAKEGTTSDSGSSPCPACNGTGKKDKGHGNDEDGIPAEFGNLHPTWNEAEYSEEATKAITKAIVQDAVIKSRGRIPGFMEREVNELLTSKVNWKSILRNFTARAVSQKKSVTWARQNRYGMTELMGRKKQQSLNLCVAIDTSASLREEDMAQFKTELHQLQKMGANITVIECDATIHRVYEFDPKKNPSFIGGGGTDFRPVFKLIDEKGSEKHGKLKTSPDALIFLTDGIGPAPVSSRIPTLWVLTEGGRVPTADGNEIKWGQVVNM